MKEQIINARKLKETVDFVVGRKPYDKVFVLTDTNTKRLCLPLIEPITATNITIDEGDQNKTLTTLEHVLQQLIEQGASRHSLLINLGGGMVSDVGGFAAAIFKRGIEYVNIPTTLLAMVDAGVGGKTGVNFKGLKNEVGAFHAPVSTLISAEFLKTLDQENILAGVAEMLKHALLDSEQMWSTLITSVSKKKDRDKIEEVNPKQQQYLYDNVKVKARFVDADPYDDGIRKALNFGHTFGHAFETFSLHNTANGSSTEAPLLHGYAVAYGMICSLYMSSVKLGFPTDKMRQTVSFIRENYGSMSYQCKDYDAIIKLMHHDKKNYAGDIRMVLLEDFGKPEPDCVVTEDEIKETLDFLSF